jgi:hypothetical protein
MLQKKVKFLEKNNFLYQRSEKAIDTMKEDVIGL